MATPVFTLLNHTLLNAADANTGWVNLTTADADIKVEGTASMSGITRNDGEDSYYDAAGAPVTAVGKVLRGWVNTTNIPYMGTEAVDPYKLWCFDSAARSNGLALFGSDTYPGGWFYFWQDMDDFTGVTLANVDRWGIEAGHASSAKNVTNMWMDVLRYLDGYYLTGGTSGDKVGIADVASVDQSSAYGIVRENFEVYFCTGTVQIGNGATTTWFEMDGDVLVFLDTPGALTISAGLYKLNVQGSGCDAVITNTVLRANGTGATTRFVMDFSDVNATLSFTDNLITRAGATTCASGQTMTGNTFDDCGIITAAGADFTGSAVKGYEGTANTSGLVWNVATDPDGLLDDMVFTKGVAATHAIEFGTASPLTMTLRGIDFSGYNAANANNDSTFHIKRTTGAVTINLIGCTGNFSYRTDGATVSLVADPATTQFTVKDADTKAVIENVRVFLVASDATGDLPYQAAVTSITRVGSVATVTTTAAHGLTTGDIGWIRGADQDEYNGGHTVTVTGATTFTFVENDTPVSPATGTITVTGGVFNELTNVSGIVTDSRVWTNSQPFTGNVRKATASPYYKGQDITGTINNATGYTVEIFMVSDE